MSEYEIEYCPWCGEDVKGTVEQSGSQIFNALECVDCEKVFNVQVPHRETEIKWKYTR